MQHGIWWSTLNLFSISYFHQILEAFYKATRQSLSALTIEHIAKIPKEQYESYGFTQPQHQKEIREFQTWYNKTSVEVKQKRLSLFNYFKSPEDERGINAVIRSSEEVFVAKFMKYVKTGAARTRQAVQVRTLGSFLGLYLSFFCTYSFCLWSKKVARSVYVIALSVIASILKELLISFYAQLYNRAYWKRRFSRTRTNK